MLASRRLVVVVVAAFLVAVNQLMRLLLHAPIRQIKKSYMHSLSACAPVHVKVDSLSKPRYLSQVSLVRPTD